MSLSTLIVHPGAPKSATSLLQESFATCDGIYCMGRPHRSAEYLFVREALTREENWSACRAQVHSFFDEARRQATGRPIVLSDEKLSKAPLLTVFRDRLAEVAPEAKVLLTIRNQVTALLSRYRAGGLRLNAAPAPYRGKRVPLADWLEFTLQHDQVTRRRYDYGQQFKILAERFEVKVLPYEYLIECPSRFCSYLSAVLGVDILIETRKRINVGHTDSVIDYISFRQKLPRISFSRLFPGGRRLRAALHRRLETQSSTKLQFNSQQAESIRCAYGASNAELARQTEIDLAGLGYPVVT